MKNQLNLSAEHSLQNTVCHQSKEQSIINSTQHVATGIGHETAINIAAEMKRGFPNKDIVGISSIVGAGVYCVANNRGRERVLEVAREAATIENGEDSRNDCGTSGRGSCQVHFSEEHAMDAVH